MSMSEADTGILITGANGHLGRRLIAELHGRVKLRAAVRSQRAAEALDGFPGLEVVQVDYSDAAGMAEACEGMDVFVHLVGIIKESHSSSYEEAHELSCAALAAALAGRRDEVRVVYVSILGASVDNANACLRSKGAAEAVLATAFPRITVLQVPMVLGEGDYAARSLAANARKLVRFGFRLGSLEQPIYAGDVVNALVASIRESFGRVLLAGPESLSRRDLFARAASAIGGRGGSVSLPLGVGLLLAAFLERVSANPPVTRAMLEVLDHDDSIDPEPVAQRLGISLTSLDDMLSRVLR